MRQFLPHCRLLLVTLLVVALPARAGERPGQAAIAAPHPLAIQAGHEILGEGGNAFDAAVAVASTLAVVEPARSGLGGGGFFLLHRAKDGKDIFLDAREYAPGAATAGMFLPRDGQPAPSPADGPLSAAIPGEPAGLAHLAQRYGRLPLARSLAPAIRLAEQGFAVYPTLQLALRFRQKTYDRWPALPAVFLVDGKVPELGAVIRQPDLAAALKRLAKGGFDGYYRGETARLLVDGVRAAGGVWTAADLEQYRVIEREPLVGEYRGTKIVAAPLPSAGGIALIDALNILSGYDLPRLEGVTARHLFIESLRRVFRDRADYLGDGDFVRVPVPRLVSPDYAAGQRTSIRLDRATPSRDLAGNWPGSEGTDTTHFSLIDADGNRVAATLSVNAWLGSGFMAPGTGIVLNDHMDDFATRPGQGNQLFGVLGGEPNQIAPHKRPLSSMSPTFLESERGVAILGTPGGTRIISMVLQASLAWMDGADAATVAGLRRYHHQYYPDVVVYQDGALTPEEQQGLAALGHRLQRAERDYGNMQVVTWDKAARKVQAASDPRGQNEGWLY